MGKYTPTVYVYPRAYYLMSLWARLGGQKSREMTCFGRAELDSRGDVYITDAYMVGHEADSAGVDADDDDINMLMFELDQKGIPPNEAFRCWVHSHPGRGDKATYLSATDEAMIDRFMLGEFLVSIVFDSVGESPYCRIDFKTPRVSIEANVEIYTPYLTTEEVKWATDIYKEKARSKPQPVFASKYKGGSYATKLPPEKKGDSSRVDHTHGFMGTSWDEESDWDTLYELNAGGADEDPGTERITEETTKAAIAHQSDEVAEYEMTATEYAYFNAQMSGHVDGIAQQVMNGEMGVTDGIDEMVKLGYSQSQAVEEMEFRLGSTVDSWAELEDADEQVDLIDILNKDEIPEYEPPPEPAEKDLATRWADLNKPEVANDTEIPGFRGKIQ